MHHASRTVGANQPTGKEIRMRKQLVVLGIVASVLIPTGASAVPREREPRDKTPIIIKVIKKLFGFTTNEDGVGVPKP